MHCETAATTRLLAAEKLAYVQISPTLTPGYQVSAQLGNSNALHCRYAVHFVKGGNAAQLGLQQVKPLLRSLSQQVHLDAQHMPS